MSTILNEPDPIQSIEPTNFSLLLNLLAMDSYTLLNRGKLSKTKSFENSSSIFWSSIKGFSDCAIVVLYVAVL